MNTVKPAAELLGQLAEAMRPAVTPDTVLVGIYTGGVWIAEWLRDVLGVKAAVGSIDVSYHRDDHHLGGGRGGGKASQLRFDVEGAHVVIVDDVLATGRTIRAAMNELFDYGRPASVTLVCLLDLDAGELPISPDVVGATLSLAPQQRVKLSGPTPLELELQDLAL